MSDQRNYQKKDRANQAQVYGGSISGQNVGNSIRIGLNHGSPIITGSVGGQTTNNIRNSFNQYTEQQGKVLTETAGEIQNLLKRLEQSHSTNTTTGKMMIATEAIKYIDNDPKMTPRVISALKAGGVSALEQLLNHPAASFFFTALEDWQQSKLE